MDNVLIMFSNLRVFKKDIDPVWEHPENKNGGKWVIRNRVNFAAEEDSIPDELVRKFLNLLIHMITGHLGFEHEICGAQLSIRPTGLVFSLWNKNSKDKKIIEILTSKLKEILQTDQITYQSHADALKTLNDSDQNTNTKPKRNQKRHTTTIPKRNNFDGDGGGATWEEIVSGLSKSAVDKAPDPFKICSTDDIPVLSKSFALKGEFSKSFGGYHFPPPTTAPKNDTKTKIYWYHRRQELKAEKDKIKTQSVDCIDKIDSPPTQKKLTNRNQIQKAPITTSQRLLPQIQQQEKQLQEQHREQLQKLSSADRGVNNTPNPPRI
jgi:hypothetical protein